MTNQLDVMEQTLLNRSENSTSVDQCTHNKPSVERFLLVAVFGTFISIIGTIENAILFLVWFKKTNRRNSHFFYLIWLAFFDTFISVSYLILISTSVWMDMYELESMVELWWFYMIPMLATSHTTMASSSYLITAATFERFLIATKSKWLKPVQRRRPLISVIAFIIALIFKGSMILEISVGNRSNCTGMTKYWAVPSSFLLQNPMYDSVFRFWTRNIVTVFLPFFLCFYFNLRIVIVLRKQHRSAQLFRIANTEFKANVRAATRMLVLIVCTYLAANLLNVFITCWEFIDFENLTQQNTEFYIYSADVVSFLTVAASSLRLPIYCACNNEIRSEIYYALAHQCMRDLKRKEIPEPDLETTQLLNGTAKTSKGATEFDRLALSLAMHFAENGTEKNDDRNDINSNIEGINEQDSLL